MIRRVAAEATMPVLKHYQGNCHVYVDAAADLICNHDFRLIRSCEGSACCLLFLDRTKGHGRGWCSMAVCGNRAKVEGHRARTAHK